MDSQNLYNNIWQTQYCYKIRYNIIIQQLRGGVLLQVKIETQVNEGVLSKQVFGNYLVAMRC